MLRVPEREEQERLISGYRARGISEESIQKLVAHWKLHEHPEPDRYDDGGYYELLTEEEELIEEWTDYYWAMM